MRITQMGLGIARGAASGQLEAFPAQHSLLVRGLKWMKVEELFLSASRLAAACRCPWCPSVVQIEWQGVRVTVAVGVVGIDIAAVV